VHFFGVIAKLGEMKSISPAAIGLSFLLSLAFLAATTAAADSGAALDPRVEAALAGSLLDVPAPRTEPGGTAPDAAAASDAATGTPEEAALADGGEAAEQNPLRLSFRRFCGEWMQKLEAREVRNAGMIDWASGTNWVQGSYVGYTRDHTCSVEALDSASPVGRLSYLEVKWERRGTSVSDAMAGKPAAVETTEVTEFFRYGDDGQWLY